MKQAVFHVDELEKWALALTNLRNMVDYYRQSGETYRIEAVATSAAVRAYADGQDTRPLREMAALSADGVRFVACHNALNAQRLSPQALASFVQVVPAGVVELVDRQADGYAYLRP